MNQRQSWKWDAEAAFKRIEKQWQRVELAVTPHRLGWTPAPDPRAYMKAKPDVYKGRDYEALTKAALRKPVGYWEDAPRGMKFGGGGEKARLANAPVPVGQMSHAAAPSAPTTPPPAAKKLPVGYYEDAPHGVKFCGKPLPSASTNPHSKDIDIADGPWPKCALSPSSERIGLSVVFIQAEAGGATTAYYTDGTTRTYRTPNGVLAFGAVCTDARAIIRALEQNGHADAAAQLRGNAINALSIPTKLIGEEFEPVGTIPVVGDVVRWGSDLVKVSRIDSTRTFSVRFNQPDGGEDGLLMSYFGRTNYDPLRILKRPTKPRDDAECRKAMGI